MATATARIPVLVTETQKARIAAMAKAAGLTMGEFLRRAAECYAPDEDEKLLRGVIDQVMNSTMEASRAIDDALAFVASSEERIARIEAGEKEAV